MATLEMRAFPGSRDPTHLLPPVYAHSAFHYDSLDAGDLVLQRCKACTRLRYPVAPVCPYCCGTDHEWTLLDPVGQIHSWIRYHKSYLPEFEALVPYVVCIVQLDAGPRIAARLLDAPAEPAIGLRLRVVVERFPSGRCVPAVVLDDAGTAVAHAHDVRHSTRPASADSVIIGID